LKKHKLRYELAEISLTSVSIV